MPAQPKQKNLELQVKNFGPIARAKIDLRPLTVFVGPSNTGKSYLAVLIYALHKFFGGRTYDLLGVGRSSVFSRGREVPSRAEVDALRQWATQVGRAGAQPEWELPPDLPDTLAKLVRERLGDTEGLVEELNVAIARSFGITKAKRLIRNETRDGMSVIVGRPVSSTGSIEYSYVVRRDHSSLSACVPEDTPLGLSDGKRSRFSFLPLTIHALQMLGSDEERERSHIISDVLGALADEYGSPNLRPLTDRSYYLPADRAGIMHAHRVVVSSLVERAPRAALEPERPLPALSGVLADFLQVLIGLSERRHGRSRQQADLAGSLEREMLEGEITDRESVTGYPEFSYRPAGWREADDLPLMHTSSMVSELAPVVLYLRHVVRPNDLLIIEEPESHLHPAMQVEFMRQLAAVVHSGVRVLITTHSEWVLDELTNLVRLSDVPASERTGIAGGEVALDREQLGVWLFEPKKRPRGSVVKEIPFDEDFGGFRSGFDEVALATYNDYAAIGNRIEERSI